MTHDEMITATRDCLLEVIKQRDVAKAKLKAATNGQGEDNTLDDLFLWATARQGLDSALSALIQLGDLYKLRQKMIKGGDGNEKIFSVRCEFGR